MIPTPQFSVIFVRAAWACGKYHNFDPERLLVQRTNDSGYVRVYEELTDPDDRMHWSMLEGELKTRALERIVVEDYVPERQP